MEDISDPPFRYLCKYFGADFLITEFISSEALIRNAEKSNKKLEINDYERPIGIQIFGNKIDSMVEAAKIAEKTKPDFIDLNFGCPVKKVAIKGSGAGLLKDIPLMVNITKEIVKAVKIPVTVKTRLGWDEKTKNIIEITQKLQDVGISAISIHARTRSQMYKGKADWELIGEIKNNPKITIPVIGNGDIDSPEKAKLMFDKYGVDGIMIGRASIGNPWIFKQIKHFLLYNRIIPQPSINEKVKLVKEHLKKSIEWKGLPIGIFEMRPHLSNYFKGIPNFKNMRIKLLTTNDPTELYDLLDEISKIY
ncbi:MAG: tRNA dihydrouridine synthase DusB [Bacteroidales bacterium]|nr:tRNA dihydrouridine synthase DusB [Bacteroidales bacterium]